MVAAATTATTTRSSNDETSMVGACFLHWFMPSRTSCSVWLALHFNCFSWQNKALILFPGFGRGGVCLSLSLHLPWEQGGSVAKNSRMCFQHMNVLLVVSWPRATDQVWKPWLWALLPGNKDQEQKLRFSLLLQTPGDPRHRLGQSPFQSFLYAMCFLGALPQSSGAYSFWALVP